MQFSIQTVLGLVSMLAVYGNTLASHCPTGSGCFRYPAGCGETGASMCELSMSWMANDANGLDFSVEYKTPDATATRWVALGFSLDGGMGDDDILMCRQTTDINTVDLEHYWSIGETIVKESATLAEDGLTDVTTAFQDGYITCNFTRAIAVAGKDHVYDLSETTTVDMMPKYFFIAGSGMVSSNVPVQHEVNPFHTSAGVNYTKAGELMLGEGSSSESDSHEGASATFASVILLFSMTCIGFLLN